MRRGVVPVALAVLALAGAGGASAAEVTGAADNLRTGWYADEPSLGPGQITEERFKQAFKDQLEGQIYAQPLVANGTLLVVTEENWAYGLDPITGAVRWAKQFGTAVEAGAGKVISCEDLEPRVGITGTPVIDSERNVAYFVSNRYVSGGSGEIGWYMHAVDLASGNELPNFPAAITGEAQNLPEKVKFEPVKQLERPALLMMNGVVYAAFGSHCDHPPYEGWIVAVSATTGQVLTKWATTPEAGAAIWQAGTGLISDGPGQILFATGNSDGEPAQEFDPPEGSGKQKPPPEGKLGESVVRVEAQASGGLATTDYFTPFNIVELDEHDLDIGSSAPVGLPAPYFGNSNVPHLLVQSGKESTVYLINRDSLGGRGATTNHVLQEFGLNSSRLHGGQGMFGGASVWPGEGGYVAIAAGHLHFLRSGEKSGAPFLTQVGETPDVAYLGSGSPIVTSNGTAPGSGVLWITWCSTADCEEGTAQLRAYSPASTGEAKPLWTANIGLAAKFTRPDASGGHIYVGNHEGSLIAFSGPALTPSSESVQLAAPTGSQVSRAVTLTSTGSELEVSNVLAPAGPFEVSGLPAPGTRLKPGEAITLNVTFKPTAPGVANGEFSIVTQAGSTRIALTGIGEESAQERSAREAREPGVSLAGGVPLAGGLVAVPAALSSEPLLSLTKLQVRARASRLSSRRGKLVISFALSGPGSVRVVIYRRVISHRCRPGVRRCDRWVATAIKLKASGRAGPNALAINLGSIRAADYRLLATPVNRSGARGITRHVDFKVLRAR